MELKLLIFHSKVIVVFRDGKLWKYHNVRGEKATCIKNWQDRHWEDFNGYLLKSLGLNSLESLSVSLLVEPKMVSVSKRLSKLFAYNDTACLLELLNAHIQSYFRTKVRLKSVPVTDDGEGIQIELNDKQKTCDSLPFLNIMNPINLQKGKTETSHSKILVTPFIEKKDLVKLNLRSTNKTKRGQIQEVQPSGFHVLVDDIRFYIPNQRVRMQLPKGTTYKPKEGEVVTLLVNGDGMVKAEVRI